MDMRSKVDTSTFYILSFLDNAPNYLVGCIIHKRCTRDTYLLYDIIGFEKIPSSGGALLVFYHACIPIDYIGLMMKIYLEKTVKVRTVMDRTFINLPGSETFFKTFGCFPGGREVVIKLLKGYKS